MKTGVVIGRWQIDELHGGHVWLLNHVEGISDKLVILVGDSPVCYTSRNPLTFEMRKEMLQARYINADIHKLIDYPNDNQLWSTQVDYILKGYDNITLYGSRDCFIPHYKGRFKVERLEAPFTMAASDIRKTIGTTISNTQDFRRGVIHAIENRFPTAYPTVDVALLRYMGRFPDLGEQQVMLGMKPKTDKWVFIGGFVDPTDESMFAAAARELQEEAGHVITHEFFYISSHKILDSRYRGTKDGIITTLVGTYMMGGNPTPSDDMEGGRLGWFDIGGFDMDILDPKHHVLFESLKKYLKK